MIITGITGSIGHGKTTLAGLLADYSRSARHFETWELVAEVANALRGETKQHPAHTELAAINVWLQPLSDTVKRSAHADITFERLKISPERLAAHPSHYVKLFEYLALMAQTPDLRTADITADNKEQFRALLQWLGGYLVIKGGSGIWYDEILRRIAHLQSAGYDLVTVGGVRYPADAERLRNAGGVIIEIQRPQLPIQDAQDITERDRTLITPDCVIMNEGDLTDLQHCAQTVYKDLQLRQLQQQYRSGVAVTSSI